MKDIKGYEGLYSVSEDGLIYSHTYKKLLKGRLQLGYVSVSLCKESKAKTFFVHRIVAQTFIPNPENKRCVNHKNSIKSDNRLNNLEWVTHKENSEHVTTSGNRIISKGNSKLVINLNTGIFYETAKEAGYAIGLLPPTSCWAAQNKKHGISYC